MVLVNSDLRELKRLGYIDIKKGAGLYLPRGNGLYLPGTKRGDGIFDYITPIANFIATNKDTIKTVADATGKVASLGSNTVDLIKQIKSNKQQKNAFDEIREKVRKGEGFKIIP